MSCPCHKHLFLTSMCRAISFLSFKLVSISHVSCHQLLLPRLHYKNYPFSSISRCHWHESRNDYPNLNQVFKGLGWTQFFSTFIGHWRGLYCVYVRWKWKRNIFSCLEFFIYILIVQMLGILSGKVVFFRNFIDKWTLDFQIFMRSCILFFFFFSFSFSFSFFFLLLYDYADVVIISK